MKKPPQQPVIWLGDTICDFCGVDCIIPKTFFDAKTTRGLWAKMCPNCFEIYGMWSQDKLGIGRGQQYKLKNGKFVKVS